VATVFLILQRVRSTSEYKPKVSTGQASLVPGLYSTALCAFCTNEARKGSVAVDVQTTHGCIYNAKKMEKVFG